MRVQSVSRSQVALGLGDESDLHLACEAWSQASSMTHGSAAESALSQVRLTAACPRLTMRWRKQPSIFCLELALKALPSRVWRPTESASDGPERHEPDVRYLLG